MTEDEDFILRPVAEGMCSYESVIESRVDLLDIARMNEYLDIRDENARRFRKANE